jgi:hypothetical protein
VDTRLKQKSIDNVTENTKVAAKFSPTFGMDLRAHCKPYAVQSNDHRHREEGNVLIKQFYITG